MSQGTIYRKFCKSLSRGTRKNPLSARLVREPLLFRWMFIVRRRAGNRPLWTSRIRFWQHSDKRAFGWTRWCRCKWRSLCQRLGFWLSFGANFNQLLLWDIDRRQQIHEPFWCPSACCDLRLPSVEVLQWPLKASCFVFNDRFFSSRFCHGIPKRSVVQRKAVLKGCFIPQIYRILLDKHGQQFAVVKQRILGLNTQ